MFNKKTGAGEVVRMPLACDPDVSAAQMEAAREILSEANASGGQVAVLREFHRMTGDDGEAQAARTPDGDAELFEPAVVEWMASAAAVKVLQRYNLSSDPADLLAVPAAAAMAHIRIPTARELDEADARAGITPALGQMRYTQAVRAARTADSAMNRLHGYRDALDRVRSLVADEVDAAARDGSPEPEAVRVLLDAAKAAKGAGGAMVKALTEAIEAWTPSDGWSKAHAAYLDALPRREREAVAAYQRWQAEQSAARAAACLVSIDGVPLDRGPDGYPVDALINHVQGGAAIVDEVARHVYALSTLGKPQRLSSLSERGSPCAEDAKACGPAASASATPSCGSDADGAVAPSDTTPPAGTGEGA